MKSLTREQTQVLIDKTVHIGVGPCGDVFCKVKYDGNRLSITGVEGPRPSGNCSGGAGQIAGNPWHISEYAPGWSAELEKKFREVWLRWHLNDMRSGCVHQRELWDQGKRVEVATYKLKPEVLLAARKAEDRILSAMKRKETAGYTDEELVLVNMPLRTTLPPVDNKYYYLVSKETKAVCNVYQTEHPEGLLLKPCPVCGYEYGTAWLKEVVPMDVITFLLGLPSTDITPAWV